MAKNRKQRRKGIQKLRGALRINPVDTVHKSNTTAAYDRQEAHCRSSCVANGIDIPFCFLLAHWNNYFFSRGSMLREWARWLNLRLTGHVCHPITDMSPGEDLERRIKERRERTGGSGPKFQSIVTPQIASTQSRESWRDRWEKPVHREPAIPRPSGDAGSEFLVI